MHMEVNTVFYLRAIMAQVCLVLRPRGGLKPNAKFASDVALKDGSQRRHLGLRFAEGLTALVDSSRLA